MNTEIHGDNTCDDGGRALHLQNKKLQQFLVNTRSYKNTRKDTLLESSG